MKSGARAILFGAFLWSGCSGTAPDTHVPEAGRYAFVTNWGAGYDADGELVILTNPAPSETHMSFTLTLNELGGPRSKTDQITWSELNDWVLVSASIGRAGSWQLLPHLKRVGDSYECYGNAFSLSEFYGVPMDCSFTYLGP